MYDEYEYNKKCKIDILVAVVIYFGPWFLERLTIMIKA